MRTGLHIGIDVGGTNTDAVLMQGRDVITWAKRQTSKDVTSGAIEAIQGVLEDSGTDPNQIDAVMVGTTHFVNAFVQRRELTPVGVIRIGLPMTSGIPPLVDWPGELKAAVGDNIFMVRGGSFYTGVSYTELDTAAIADAGKEIKARGLESVAISSVFAPIRPDLEISAEKIIRECAGDLNITLSHTVGGIGLIERENAAAVNAALFDLARQVVTALREALSALDMKASLYFSQNDGTLMSTEAAIRFPVMTCSAGPTNSIRGAAFLTGLSEAVVVDIGGTTTDVGVLQKGFARETTDSIEIGGVRTNFTMPDVLSIGLGGGTVVHIDESDGITLGPDSVGFRLLEKGKAFGGDTLTASDIAVLRGRLAIGDASLVTGLTQDQVDRIAEAAHRKVDAAVDQLKTSAAPVPVVLVGGGSVLIDGDLDGASDLIRPENGTVANAIGAAIAQVGGRVKRLYDYSLEGGRDAAIEKAIKEATGNAIRAGALANTVEVVDIEEYPMTHMQTSAVDVRVRVAGDLDVTYGGD